MGLTIDQIIGKAKPPVRSVWVCLDGELWSRHDDLSRQLDQIRAVNPVGKMGDAAGVGELAQELRQVEASMRDAEVEFKFRGISSYRLEEIQKAHPAESGSGWNASEGAADLLAASAVEPAMTPEQARQLLETVSEAAAQKLYGGAWLATTGSADVPFSGRAFATTSGTGSK